MKSGRITPCGFFLGLCGLLGLLVAFPAVGTVAAGDVGDKPTRIVSLNLCADQMLLLLAERDRIASLSFLAKDPRSSLLADQVGDIPTNRGGAEEILLLKPDLILAGAYTTGATVALLRRLGLRVVELPLTEDLGDVRENLRSVGNAIGERERAGALIEEFDARLRSLRADAPKAEKSLGALLWAGGVTSGSNTFAASILQEAGFENLADRFSVQGMAPLSLEALLLARPDAVFTGQGGGRGASLASGVFQHPALLSAMKGRPLVALEDPLWACGVPQVLDAVERLMEARFDVTGSDTLKRRAIVQEGP